jgi:hypothetical protein
MMQSAVTTEVPVEPILVQESAPAPITKSSPFLDYAVLGCLIGGALAIIKALEMKQALDALVCLPASVGAVSFVCYLYFRRD